MSRPDLSVVLLAAAAWAGCAEPEQTRYQGYVEGESVYVAAPSAGELFGLEVEEGEAVEKGAPLFRLDPNPQALQVAQTEERIRQARAQLADLEKGGRPSELAAIEARLASADASLRRAERDLERRRALLDAGHADAVTREELGRYETDRDVRQADVAALRAELETARLGARPDALEAARSEVDALVAQLAEQRWQLERRSAVSPASGRVEDVLYRPGEYVPAGRPVLSLLPPGNVKVRFFVPQAVLPSIAIGDRAELRLDGLERAIPARISFVSSEAEFTPPVIYSNESRDKLVFLVEALPDPEAVEHLHPGQPLDVHLAGARP